MTRRPPRGALNAVVATLAFVLACAILAAPASAAADPHKPARKHAAKRHVKKRVTPGLRAVQIANHLTGIPYSWGGASPRVDSAACTAQASSAAPAPPTIHSDFTAPHPRKRRSARRFGQCQQRSGRARLAD